MKNLKKVMSAIFLTVFLFSCETETLETHEEQLEQEQTENKKKFYDIKIPKTTNKYVSMNNLSNYISNLPDDDFENYIEAALNTCSNVVPCSRNRVSTITLPFNAAFQRNILGELGSLSVNVYSYILPEIKNYLNGMNNVCSVNSLEVLNVGYEDIGSSFEGTIQIRINYRVCSFRSTIFTLN